MKKKLLTILLCLLISGCQTVQDTRLHNKGTTYREIYASDISFNAKTGEIKYTLPEPALVRVRIGLRDGGAFLRHLVDWERRGPGEHTEIWNKRDATGKVYFGQRRDLMLVLSCITEDGSPKNNHASMIKGFRKEPKLEVSFPESVRTTDDGFPVLTGQAPVRITLAPQDRAWLTGTKYEVAMFVDYAFLMEDEEGTNPFTYHLDTVNMNDGVHMITVNIIGYEGEIGTKSVVVYVNNSEA